MTDSERWKYALARQFGPDGRRALAWSLAWTLTLGYILSAVNAPTWCRVATIVLVTLTVMHATENRLLHTTWLRFKYRDELHQPLVLDEDGIVRAPVILPGEELQVAYDRDGRPFAGRIIEPNGRVRSEASWTARR
jgi:hypothetical protein